MEFSVCTMRSWMWIYFNILLVIWSSCYNTSVTGIHASCPLELNPPSVVVRYGASVSVNCSTPSTDHHDMGWEAVKGATGQMENVNLVVLTVANWEHWDASPICYINMIADGQCEKTLPIVLYTFPDNITISSNADSAGPMYEGEQYTFTCGIRHIAPVQNLTVTWYIDTTILNTSFFDDLSKKPQNVLANFTFNASRRYDGARFRCEAFLNLGPEGPQQSISSEEYPIEVHSQDCPKPTNGPANTVLISADILKPTFPNGTTATWECETGYAIEGGNRKQTCRAGTWTPAVVTLLCDRKSCRSIPEPDNGRIDFPEGTQFGDKAVITCNTGYNLVPARSNERSCGADGTWMGRFGRCEVVKCGKPVDIENGRFSPVNDDYDYGAVVTYKCNRGLTLNGQSSLDCQTDGQFHPAPPTCIMVNCETPNVPNLNRFEGPPPPYGHRHHVTFKCDAGFEMVGSRSVTCEISGWSPPLPQCKVQPQVIGSSQPVMAMVGDDVILPCHVEPPVNMENKTVEWTRRDLNPQYVYLLQEGRVTTDQLNPLYKGRTSLFDEQLSHGNISLKLTRVKLSDQGKYECYVPGLKSSSSIQLLVGSVSQPVISLTGIKGDLLSWRCDSGCWYPEPEVSWLDSDGNNINAEPSVTEKPSDHCYVVQRTVTVDLEHVTCRVHLPHFNHTVETHSVKAGPQVIGSSQPVMAKVGDYVILPCHVEPPVNMESGRMEWTRPDLDPEFVHLLQDGRDTAEELNPSYKQRTSLFDDELSHGNISLKLTRVKLSDEGTYMCSVPILGNSFIQLLVGSVSQPMISLIGIKGNLKSWRCDSGCWFPEPEMSWLDSDGNNINAEPSATEKPSDHCYVVQRKVTVALTEPVTCRVHLPHINHSVETHSVKAEDKKPGVIAGIVIPVIIILVAAILGCLYWKKKKQTKRDKATASFICQGDEGQIFLQEPSESKEMTNMSVEEEGQRHDVIPITSPEPRKWTPVSKRWRPKLEKLANIDDCKVIKVGSLVLVTDEEFRIAKGSDGIEVFLGLTDDGTEVAVKRMAKFYFQALKKDPDFLRLPKLDHPSIVRYVDFAGDDNFGYLGLQLCEYTLEEYITERSLSELERKQLAHQFFQSLHILHRQDPTIIHRELKPQNILIDIQSKARLSDFGIRRESPQGQTTMFTRVARTKCWKAKETLDDDDFQYDRSTDIQVAGMLIYYILSGGHHPFGTGIRCETNILDGKYKLDQVQDVVANDLIERMINEEPEERPRVEECLAHPYFWTNERRVEYLRRIGKEVENCPDDDKDLITVLDQYAELGQFNTWKHKFPLELKMDEMKSYPENSFGLLRFIHNLHEHYAEEAAGVDLMELFPGLFGCVYQFAQKQDWNSRPTLKDMFQTEDVFTSSV